MVLTTAQLLNVRQFIRDFDAVVEVPTLHFVVSRDGADLPW